MLSVSIIHTHQWEYYAVINTSNVTDESTVFIEFILSAIRASLIEVINMSDEIRIRQQSAVARLRST